MPATVLRVLVEGADASSLGWGVLAGYRKGDEARRIAPGGPRYTQEANAVCISTVCISPDAAERLTDPVDPPTVPLRLARGSVLGVVSA